MFDLHKPPARFTGFFRLTGTCAILPLPPGHSLMVTPTSSGSTPVTSPTISKNRLSKHEERIISAAFHRARGYEPTMSFGQFRDSVMHEAFVAMPLELVRWVFQVWSPAGGTQTLTLKEFVAGVTTIVKGSREEHLQFVFQLMAQSSSTSSRHKSFSSSSSLARDDTLVFLQIMSNQQKENNVVAVERIAGPGIKRWSRSSLLLLLHPTTTDTLTPGKFVKILASRSFEELVLVDWIPRFAVQFVLNAARMTAQPDPLSFQLLPSPASASAELIDPLTIRIASSPVSEHREVEPVETPASQYDITLKAVGSNSFVAESVPSPADSEWDAIKREFLNLLEYVVATNEPLPFATIKKQFEPLVPARLLSALQIISTEALEASDTAERGCADARHELRMFMIGFCSAFTCDAVGVLRYLFALFDQEQRGYLTTERLALFLRFATDVSQIDSERWAEAVVASDMAASTMSFDQFLNYVDGSLSSSTRAFTTIEVEHAHLLFHLQFARSDPELSRLGQNELCARAVRMLKTAIAQCSVLGSQKNGRNQEAPTNQCCCVLEHQVWLRIMDFLCTSSEESSEGSDLRSILGDHIPVLPATSFKNGGRYSREVGLKTPLALVPISIWTTIAFLHRHHWQSQIADMRAQQWLSQVDFTVKDEGTGQEEFQFSGYSLALSLKWTAVDDTELDAVLPRVVLSETRSIHELVVAVRTLNEWPLNHHDGSGSDVGAIDLIYECQLRFSANGMDDQQIKSVSPEQMKMPIKRLLREHSDPDSAVQGLVLHVTVLDTRMESTALESTGTEEEPEEPSISKARSRVASVGNCTSWNSIHGLVNLGNTCFMNSALQCLVATPLLREYFLQHEYLHDLAPHISTPVDRSTTSRSQSASKVNASLLPLAFGQLMRKMNAYTSAGAISGVCDVISPTELNQTLAALFPDLSDGSQQDAQEFLSSLLSGLSDELKRTPQHAAVATESESPPAAAAKGSPRSFLARMACTSSDDVVEDAHEQQPKQSCMLQPSDSNGRPDHLVAQEWWLSHLLREPSVITALFSGQYKSVLTCSACGFQSVRFEPFSSLQLPLKLDENAEGDLPLTADPDLDHSDAIVLLHFAESPVQRASLRLALRVRSDWTLDQLFLKLEQDFATFSHGHRRQYAAASVAGPSIQDLLDCDSLLITLLSPIHVYELEHVSNSGAKIPLDRVLMDEAHDDPHVSDQVLVWGSSDRYIKGQVVVRHRNPMDLNATCVDVTLQEGISDGKTLRNISRVVRKSPRTLETRVLYLRFMHRQTVLVPFYCTSPYRQVAFGFPFVHRARAGAITGRSLYAVVRNRFVSKDKKQADQSFVLRHVRWDGKACKRCHWSLQCRGCVISPTGDDPLLDLEMDDVIAIEWQSEAATPMEETANQVDTMLRVEDDESYVVYCQANAQPLERSLELLCSTERLDAHCSQCQQRDEAASSPASRIFTPHTKALMLWSVPPVLVIQLKRFELDAHGDSYRWKKLTQGIDLPLDRLSLRRFLSPAARTGVSDAALSDAVLEASAFLTHELHMPLDSASRTCSAYSLFGIVNHMGDLGSGHYTSHIRHPESGDWWLVDDATAEQVHDPRQQLTPSSAAYLLFYVRHDIAASSGALEPAPQSDRRLKRLGDFFPRRGRSASLNEQTLQTQIQTRQSGSSAVRSPSAASHDACGFM